MERRIVSVYAVKRYEVFLEVDEHGSADLDSAHDIGLARFHERYGTDFAEVGVGSHSPSPWTDDEATLEEE